jgi:hypothetical protein
MTESDANRQRSNVGADSGANKPRTFLRPESIPLRWKRLDKSQKRSILHLVQFLQEAVRSLDEESKRPRPYHHSFYRPALVNRTCALNGVRGSGKTSVLKTLFELTKSESEWKQELTEFVSKNSDKEEIAWTTQVLQHLEKLKSRLVWLDPIDMEVLPGPSNLLASILSRIEEMVDPGIESGKDSRDEPGMLTFHAPSERALIQLRMLMQDVTLAWDGNMPERGEHIDPDTFASEVIRAERARVRIPDRVSSVLADLSTSSKPPLYVLPVDDFDMSPTRCLELLRLIRMLNVPELFTIVLGDIDTTEEVLHIKLTGEFAKVADVQLHADFIDGKFHQARQKTASDALRKLIPPNHRMRLGNMTKHEALDYQPTPDDKTIGDLLSGIRIRWEAPWFGAPIKPSPVDGVPSIELACMLFGGPKPNPRWRTTSAAVLTRPPRVIADLWQDLSDLIPEDGSTLEPHVVINGLAELLYNEAQQISEPRENLLKRLFGTKLTTKSSSGEPIWVCDPSLVCIEISEQTTYESSVQTDASHSEYCLATRVGGDWYLKDLKPRAEMGETKEQSNLGIVAPDINNRMMPWLTLIHDLVRALSGEDTFEQTLVPRNIDVRPISTVWRNKTRTAQLSIPWPAPEFSMFVEYDCFLEEWRSRLSEPTPQSFQRDRQAGHLIPMWISLQTEFLLPAPVDSSQRPPWYVLSVHHPQLVCQLVCLVAPEFNVLEAALTALAIDSAAVHFIVENVEPIRQERLKIAQRIVEDFSHQSTTKDSSDEPTGLADSKDLAREILGLSIATLLGEEVQQSLQVEPHGNDWVTSTWKLIREAVVNLPARAKDIDRVFKMLNPSNQELLGAYLELATRRFLYLEQVADGPYVVQLKNAIGEIIDLPFDESIVQFIHPRFAFWASRFSEKLSTHLEKGRGATSVTEPLNSGKKSPTQAKKVQKVSQKKTTKPTKTQGKKTTKHSAKKPK